MFHFDVFNFKRTADSPPEVVALRTRRYDNSKLVDSLRQLFRIDGLAIIIIEIYFKRSPVTVIQTGFARIGQIGQSHHIRMLEAIVMHIAVNIFRIRIRLKENRIDRKNVLTTGNDIAILIRKHLAGLKSIGSRQL